MKVRITMRNKYIVEEVEDIEEALAALALVVLELKEIKKATEALITFEHGLVLSTEEIKEAMER